MRLTLLAAAFTALAFTSVQAAELTVLAPGFVLAPDPAEVADIFEVPLAFFADAANRRRETRVWNGHQRSFYAYSHGGHEIWGATAAVIVDLVSRLDDRVA